PHSAEHGVSGEVAAGVVVSLEVVDVEQQQRDRMAVAPGALALRGEGVLQVAAVVESGELVGDGELLQLLPPFPEPGHHRVEYPGERADLAAGGHGKVHRKVAAGYLRGAFDQPVQR